MKCDFKAKDLLKQNRLEKAQTKNILVSVV